MLSVSDQTIDRLIEREKLQAFRVGRRLAIGQDSLRRYVAEKIVREHEDGGLGQDALYDLAVDIGEPEVPAGVAEGQLLVVESEQVEDGRL
jgi:excisionase family DNA binding protein